MDYVSSYVSVLISNYIISNKENKEIKESNSSWIKTMVAL